MHGRRVGQKVGGRRARLSALLCAALVCLLASVGAPSPARADSYSGTYRILPASSSDNGGRAADAVSCASPTQCTAVSAYGFLATGGGSSPGFEVTFDPATQTVNAAGVKEIDPVVSGGAINAVSCPALTQCTAVDSAGQEITFNPGTGQADAPVTLSDPTNPGGALFGVSCPATTQCTAVTSIGEVTFNPGSGAVNSAGFRTVYQEWTGVSCPSLTQCTATGDNSGPPFGGTFDPQTGALQTTEGIARAAYPGSISCPTTTLCVQGSSVGGPAESSFDPQRSYPAGRLEAGVPLLFVPGQFHAGLACATAALCTTGTLSFDPASPFGAGSAQAPPVISSAALACASANECVAVTADGLAYTITPALTLAPPSEVAFCSADPGSARESRSDFCSVGADNTYSASHELGTRGVSVFVTCLSPQTIAVNANDNHDAPACAEVSVTATLSTTKAIAHRLRLSSTTLASGSARRPGASQTGRESSQEWTLPVRHSVLAAILRAKYLNVPITVSATAHYDGASYTMEKVHSDVQH